MAEQGTMSIVSGKSAHLELEILVTVHVCGGGGGSVMCLSMYVLAVCGRYLPQLFSTLFSEMGSICEPAVTDLCRLAGQ